MNEDNVSRRALLATGGGLAAAGLVAAASALPASAQPDRLSAGETRLEDQDLGISSGTHVITTPLGLATSTYSPGLTATPGSVSVHCDAAFVGAVTVDGALLVSDRLDGQYVGSCTGQPSGLNLNGEISYADGSHSVYHIDSTTTVRVQGHTLSGKTGTINAGRYTGATIQRLAIRLAEQPVACATGGAVTSSTGHLIVIIDLP